MYFCVKMNESNVKYRKRGNINVDDGTSLTGIVLHIQLSVRLSINGFESE